MAGCTKTSTSPTTARSPVRFNLEIAIRADFADIFEVKSDNIVRRGRITTSWSDKRQTLRFTYRNKDFCREVIVRTGEGDGEPAVNANGRLSFDIALKAGQAWHRCLIYDLVDGAKRIRAPRECTHSSTTSDHAAQDGRVAAHSSENRHQQRGILSLLQSRRAGHGRACDCR